MWLQGSGCPNTHTDNKEITCGSKTDDKYNLNSWGPIKGKLLKFHITKMFEHEAHFYLSAKQFEYQRSLCGQQLNANIDEHLHNHPHKNLVAKYTLSCISVMFFHHKIKHIRSLP